MFVLGIESSCDETAAAVAAGSRRILSSVISSQIEVHQQFGGVVPELASRHHLVNVIAVVQQAMSRAQRICPRLNGFSALDGVAVTAGPGLVGSLMVGLQVAKGIALAARIPLIGVNHLEAHLESVYAVTDFDGKVKAEKGPSAKPNETESTVPVPHVALLVSGGHTLLIYVRERGNYRVLGSTRDDAAGEAFDKVAKMLHLGYPGGVEVEKLARGADPTKYAFPRALRQKKELDFSFSGLKTAVRNHLIAGGQPESKKGLADLCASVQEAIVDPLVRKAAAALEAHDCKTLVLAGGVAANGRLRKKMKEMAHKKGYGLIVPDKMFCTDNGAMVAINGARKLAQGEVADLDLDAAARWLPSPRAT